MDMHQDERSYDSACSRGVILPKYQWYSVQKALPCGFTAGCWLLFILKADRPFFILVIAPWTVSGCTSQGPKKSTNGSSAIRGSKTHGYHPILHYTTLLETVTWLHTESSARKLPGLSGWGGGGVQMHIKGFPLRSHQ